MTNDTLSRVLRKIDISKGEIVRSVGNLEAVLIEQHKTVIRSVNGTFGELYDYLILLKGGNKAGIILKCGAIDIHIYMYHKYRNQHIVSDLIGDGFLRRLWPDIESVTCVNDYEYNRIKHLAQIAGYTLRGN